jgi:hypothetical protein
MPTPPRTPIYSRDTFLVAFLVTGLFSIAVLGGFWFFGTNPPISEGGWYALCGAFAALVLKMLVADWGHKEFEAHKHGYDMCVMALGTALSTLAYELSKEPLVRRRIVFLFVLFLLALVGTFLAGGNTRSIESRTTSKPAALKWMNIGLGFLAIGLNLFFLVVKDQGSNTNRSQHAVTVTSNQPNGVKP